MIDSRPQTATWNSSISTKSVCASTGGGECSNSGKEKNAQKEEEEAETTGRAAGDSLEEQPDWLPAGNVQEHLDIR